jgi:hypothetical protein
MPRGDAFEAEVAEAIEKAVASGKLGLLRESCRVLRHKRYYSRDRMSDIEVDIALEVFLPGASNPTILWIWDCKDYANAIPISDVEEFHAKLQQIGADNTKGTLIARGPFQRSALRYATSKGIGICRLLPKHRIEWVLRSTGLDIVRRQNQPENFVFHLLEPNCWSLNSRDFYGVSPWGGIEPGDLLDYIRFGLTTMVAVVELVKKTQERKGES